MSSGIDTTLAKWGNSTGIRIPRAIAEQADLREGDAVSIAAEGPGVLIVRAVKSRLTLENLVSRITPQNRHAETAWEDARGNEVW